MIGKALLVVDCDSEPLYRAALSSVGFAVCSASSAAAATVQCANDGPFDLVIEDIRLDSRDGGGAFARYLRAVCPAIRILFLSVSPLNLLLKAGVLAPDHFAGGGAAFLRKPLPLPVMMSRIWGLLDGSRVGFPEPESVSPAPLTPARRMGPASEDRQYASAAGMRAGN